jgi:U3 small nucleolar RNA-associated protein 19
LIEYFIYKIGGVSSILALNGLFTLIIDYNLDYPLFYHKLYALLDQNILHVKYRSRFFRLVDLFLSSSMIPSKMVASFLKRILRLTLWAPPAGILLVLPLIFNLLRKHPLCIEMIHKVDHLENSATDVIKGKPSSSYIFYFLTDSFLETELDPSQTNAISSSLWELQMLKKHYCPQISKLASIFEDSLARPSYDLEDFLDQTYKSLMDLDLEKKRPKELSVQLLREIPFSLK